MNQLYQLYDSNQFTRCESLLNQYLLKYPEHLHLLTLKAHLILQLHNNQHASTSPNAALFPNQISVRAYNRIRPIIHRLLTQSSTTQEKTEISQQELAWIRSTCLLFKRLALYEPCFQFMQNQINRYKNVKSEELWNFAFFSLCRLDAHFDLQASWAMKMFQFWKNQKYLKWSYLSNWMHHDEKRRQLAQVLAHKSLLDSAKDELFHDEWLRFVLGMMKEMNQWDNMVKLLVDARSASIDHLLYDRKTFLAEALRYNKQYHEACALYAYLLEQDNDEWTWWSGFLDTLAELEQARQEGTLSEREQQLSSQDTISLRYNIGGSDKKKNPESMLEMTNHARNPLDFIHQMQQEMKKKPQHKWKRGTFLAELEYLHSKGDDANLKSKCAEYFSLFSTKSLCFDDLKKYVTREIYDCICERREGSSEEIDSLSRIRTLTTLRKIERCLKVFTFKDTDYLTQLLTDYTDALKLGQNLEKTENQHGDDILLLCVHYMLDSIIDEASTGDSATPYTKLSSQTLNSNTIAKLLQCILLLENGLEHSAYNYQFKVMLIRLYCLVGAFKRARSIFMSMDIKHILFESTSYMVVYDAFEHSSFDTFASLAKKVVDFRYQHERETPDLLLLAYRNETYSKVSEFIDFQQKLDTSVTTCLCAAQSHLFELGYTSIAENIIEKLQLNLKPLHMIERLVKNPHKNDDLSVLSNFERSTSQDIGHPIIVPAALSRKESPSFDAAAYHLLAHIVNSLAEIVFCGEQYAHRAKLMKQIAKKKKKAKKLTASLNELPSEEELEKGKNRSRSMLKDVCEMYEKIMEGGQDDSSPASLLAKNVKLICRISSIIASEEKDQPLTQLTEQFEDSCKQLNEQLEPSILMGKYHFHFTIYVLIMNLWKKIQDSRENVCASGVTHLLHTVEKMEEGMNAYKKTLEETPISLPEFAKDMDQSQVVKDHLEKAQLSLDASLRANHSLKRELKKLVA